MKTFIVFLRGINVSGQKKIRMAELRTCLSEAGFKEVRTYIQSGNLVLDSSATELNISERVQRAILDTFGFNVPVLTLDLSNLQAIIKKNPYPATQEYNKGIYFVLLYDEPDAKAVETLENETFNNEEFTITPSSIYLKCHKGYGRAKCNNNFFERRLNIQATARNWKTITTLEEMALSNST
ncbi:MAG: DUF1697 domain-containing protein [Eudoraea sp.]|nr:DUF1697 domain-containing protein [Eudoraea sp.]